MAVLRERPQQAQVPSDDAYKQILVAEIAPHPLMHAFDALRQANPGKIYVIREHFPVLESVGLRSPRYVDEELWLNSTEIGQLIEELQKLRRVCRREKFISQLNGPATYERWRGSDPADSYDQWLDRIETLLQMAYATSGCIRLML
jgi:hypothetical protein